MSAVRGSRLWVVAGLVLALALTGATYVLVISPARAQVASVQSQVDDASVQQTVLRHRLRDLQAASQQLGDLRTKLAAAKAALPATVDTQGLLRRIQLVASAAGAGVDTVTIGSAEASSVDGVFAVPVTIVLTGSPASLVAALAQVQSDTSRLVTVSGSALKQEDGAGYTLSLTVQVYATAPPVAAAVGTAAPGAASTAAAATAAAGSGAAAAGASAGAGGAAAASTTAAS